MMIEDLPVETEERIIADFRKQRNIDDEHLVWVSNYLGTYNGKVAVVVDGPFGYAAVITYETVAGVTFRYAHAGPNINIWHNGNFYRLQNAYDSGLITQDDLFAIQKRWNSRWNIQP